MTLKEVIFERFKMSHYGKKRAIKIRDLLFDIQELWDYSEREMRAAYEDLPICGSSKGLYLPETQVEIDEQVLLHRKKIIAYAKKIKVLKRYKISTDSVQKELF